MWRLILTPYSSTSGNSALGAAFFRRCALAAAAAAAGKGDGGAFEELFVLSSSEAGERGWTGQRPRSETSRTWSLRERDRWRV